MRIRPAREDDAARIAELAVELGYPTSAAEAAARLDRIAAAGDGHVVLVAEDAAGEVVGWIHGFESLRVETDPFAEIGGLVVAGSARGEGVGEALVAEVARWAGAHGQARLRVRSNVVRERARGFYERLGFARVKDQAVLDLDLQRQRLRRGELERSLREPQVEAGREVAEAGLEDWCAGGAEGDDGLVDPSLGRPLRWTPGEGWREGER